MCRTAGVGRLCVAVLVVMSAVAAGSVPVAGAPTTGDGERSVLGERPAASVEAPTAPPANNTTQHRDPERVDESGDLGQVERWLGGRMGALLAESTLQLSQSEYDRARGLLGDDYNSHLERYVDVAGATSGSDDDGQAETYQDARSTQETFVETVEEYREQRAAYQEAKSNGNEDRARRLARNISRNAGRIQALSRELTSLYGEIESFSETDLGPATSRVTAISENVTVESERIVAAEFVRTRLDLRSASTAVSFTDPLRVSGQVASPNGSVGVGTVVVRLGPQVERVDVTENGTFDASIRPTLAPRGDQNVTLRYIPPEESGYLGTNETLPVSVSPVTPTISLSGLDKSIGYGDEVSVTASVVVNGTPVAGLPVGVRLAGITLGNTRTTGDGIAEQPVRIPATIQPGTHALSTVLQVEDRAIAGTAADVQVRVVETPTRLGLDARDGVIRGRLLTADGRPVTGQPVAITVAGETRTVETNASGGFALSLPRGEDDAQPVDVRARFDGSATNLESATATTTAVLPAAAEPEDPGDGGVGSVARSPPVQWGAGLLLVVGLLGALGWYARRRSAPTTETPTTTPGTDTGDESVLEESESATEAPFAAVESLLESGSPTDSVLALYHELRERRPVDDGDASRTHWEYHDATVARTPDAAPALRTVTTAYEQAAFSPDGVDDATATDALDAARVVLDSVDDAAASDALDTAE